MEMNEVKLPFPAVYVLCGGIAFGDGDVGCGIYTAGNVIFAIRTSVTFPTVLITIYRLRRISALTLTINLLLRRN